MLFSIGLLESSRSALVLIEDIDRSALYPND